MGVSFYSLQMISYLADIYSGKVTPQSNVLKYALFISFFPQLIQGPIPRYHDLSHQLTDGNEFDPDNVQRGFQLILWGFFLKLMVADKASVIVDTVFNNWQNYYG
ncbi:MAG: MBOAT family protein, partial [Oribacterium sp.]|nr:MBOAT family protein [Oribacterium sp.]